MTGSCISTVRRGAAILAIALLCSACSTTWTPIQGAIANPAQVFAESADVRGLRANVLYAKNASIDGLDVGVVNDVEGRARGIQLAGFANFAKELDGLGGGLVNKVEERVRGVQVAGFANVAGELDGLNVGIVNSAGELNGLSVGIANSAEELDGLGVGLANKVDKRVRGVQLAGAASLAGELAGVQFAGILNQSESVVGVQISGIANYTEELVGLQIGLLNFNMNGPLWFFPFFNFGFSGESAEVKEGEAGKD